MPFVPTLDTAKVAVIQSLDNQQVINTMWFTYFSGWTEELLQDLAEAVHNGWETRMLPLLSDDLTLREVTATDMESETGPSVSFIVTPFPAGGIVGTSMPNNVAACVTFLTAGRGRSARGRNYLAGITGDAATNNTMNSNFMGDVIDAYAGLKNDLAALGFNHAVVSFQNDGVPRSAGLPQTVTGYRFADATLDSQRRRLPGRGE